jgi:hypothetical protein
MIEKLLNKITDDFSVFMEEIMGVENAPFHNELDEKLSNKDIRWLVWQIFRGSGKTQHGAIGYSLWEMAKNHNIRILIISSTSTIAAASVKQILNNVEGNEKYKVWARFVDPKHVGVVPNKRKVKKAEEQWSSEGIIIDRDDLMLRDATVQGIGLFGATISRRADIIILDDIVNQQNSETQEQRDKIKDWVYTSALPILVPGGRFIVLGNAWHDDDFMSDCLKNPMFTHRKRLSAILKDPDDMGLWKDWYRILTDQTISPEEAKKRASLFLEEHREEMYRGVSLSWPERFSYEQLYLLERANSYSFSRMYRCDTAIRPNQAIRESWIQKAIEKGRGLVLSKNPPKEYTVSYSTGGMDLAIKGDESGDETSLLYLDCVLNGNDKLRAGDFVIRDIDAGHFSPREQRQKLIEGHKMVMPLATRVESNGYQMALVRDMQEENSDIAITAYHTGGEKKDSDVGINILSVLLENERLAIPFNTEDRHTIEESTKLINEMRKFPDGHTGDRLMSLWFAYSEARDRMGDRVIVANPNYTAGDKPEMDLRDPETLKREEKKVDLALAQEQEYERQVFNQLMGR